LAVASAATEYCLCIKAFDEKSSEVMIECLGKNCPFNNWFYLKCVKLTDVPVDDWFCMACIRDKSHTH
jgi:hypothetical protein